MTKHTHTGHCQACGRMQAIGKSKNRDNLAKHGYMVAGFGFFNGVCGGSDRLPLEQEKDYSEQIIVSVTEYAARMDVLAGQLTKGEAFPKMARTDKYIRSQYIGRHVKPGTGCYEEVLFAEATPSHQERAVKLAIGEAQREAEQARTHARQLKALIISVHGTALRPVDPPKELAIGDKFQINGKGEYTVLEFKFKSSGWSSRTYKHVVYMNDKGLKCNELMRNVTRIEK